MLKDFSFRLPVPKWIRKDHNNDYHKKYSRFRFFFRMQQNCIQMRKAFSYLFNMRKAFFLPTVLPSWKSSGVHKSALPSPLYTISTWNGILNNNISDFLASLLLTRVCFLSSLLWCMLQLCTSASSAEHKHTKTNTREHPCWLLLLVREILTTEAVKVAHEWNFNKLYRNVLGHFLLEYLDSLIVSLVSSAECSHPEL